MKNPMIENSINPDLFEAIDENEVNGGKINSLSIMCNVMRVTACGGVICELSKISLIVCK